MLPETPPPNSNRIPDGTSMWYDTLKYLGLIFSLDI